ncbi:hypothetical protein [Sporofaciens sp. JLR.KK001]|jgi:hypothetical protein|uniref:hypothetical protein n=1 Tax=Sporofaciens sp. JLR.KK001 TaxID=3112621 RepID=UPI002FF36AF8
MKRIKLYFTVFMTICLCSACGKPQETTEDPSHKTIGSDNWKQTGETSESVETVSIQIPETYERTEENVYFKADIICPDEIRKGSVKIPKISLQLINEEKVIDEIYKNISIDKDEVKEYPGDDGEVLKVRYLTGPEIQSLSVYSFGADYTTAFYRDYIGHSFDLEGREGHYSTEAQLSFMSTDSARSEIEGMFDRMEVSLGEDPFFKHYALDYQTLAAQEYVMDMDGNIDRSQYKPEWTMEDEGYYFCIWQTYNGIKVHTPYSDMIKKYADFNAPVQVMISANGLEYLSLGRTFLIDPKESTEKLASLDAVADVVIKKYSMILTDATYTIDRMELCYYPVEDSEGNYELKCVWIMDITEEPTLTATGRFQLMVDAVSGEELF